MNIIIIEGRLTRDPESKTTQNGSTYTTFYVADERIAKGNEKKTTFHSCIAWGKKGEFVSQYFTKGKPISVIGNLQMEKYEKDGHEVTFYRVVADQVNFVVGDSSGKTEKPQQNELPFPEDDCGLSF